MTTPCTLPLLFRITLLLGLRSRHRRLETLLRNCLVEQLGWMSDADFAQHAAMSANLPGLRGLTLVCASGIHLRGLGGALAASAGYIGPGLVCAALLAGLWHIQGGAPWFAAGLRGVLVVSPAICLYAGLHMLFTATGRKPLAWALAAAAGLLFFIGLKPFSMLMGGAVLGVLLTPDPAGPAPGTDCCCEAKPYPWGTALAAALPLAVAAGLCALLDASLGRLMLWTGKAGLFSLGGFGLYPLLFADLVRLRQWLDPVHFAQAMTLVDAIPGPYGGGALLLGARALGLGGLLAAAAGAFLPTLVMAVAVQPVRGAVAACKWAPKALGGVSAVLAGLCLGLGAQLISVLQMAPGWDTLRIALAAGAFVTLLMRNHPGIVLGAAFLAGATLL
ncbi:chromate transporter [Fundidesulfovibrio agrisoli]|uniref:chromate transporter n=1 Tax=Fundidesulfovibrio agrisoli TaxID=2922717 RepID=UPI001FAD8C72|nr:chromate transporter [Fundidesulfovibrio agrisoli]